MSAARPDAPRAMLDHASIPVRDFERSARFYDGVLATLGLQRRLERPESIGWGPDPILPPIFWIHRAVSESASPGRGLHLSFRAASRQQVDAFHAAALALGARDAGAPGPRPHYTAGFYGAFALDPDGYKIEAVFREALAGSS